MKLTKKELKEIEIISGEFESEANHGTFLKVINFELHSYMFECVRRATIKAYKLGYHNALNSVGFIQGLQE